MNAHLPVNLGTAVLYQLQSVMETSTPEDCEGTWYRYVIAHGTNEITGLRAGNAADVEQALHQMVEHLNVRSSGKTIKPVKKGK